MSEAGVCGPKKAELTGWSSAGERLGSTQVHAPQLRTSCTTLPPPPGPPGATQLERRAGAPLFSGELRSLSAQLPEWRREIREPLAAPSDVYFSSALHLLVPQLVREGSAPRPPVDA